MSKISIFIIIVCCLVAYSGFALDIFYSRSVYDFESCSIYGVLSTSTQGVCTDIQGVVFYSPSFNTSSSYDEGYDSSDVTATTTPL